jgi:hypothetical protein
MAVGPPGGEHGDLDALDEIVQFLEILGDGLRHGGAFPESGLRRLSDGP